MRLILCPIQNTSKLIGFFGNYATLYIQGKLHFLLCLLFEFFHLYRI